MNSSKIRAAIAELHETPHKVYLACTGAGAGLQGMLQEVAHASGTLLGSRMLYDQIELTDFLDWHPAKFVSEEVALRMATASYHRARELLIRSGRKDLPAIGLGLTAAIATNRPRRGAEHAFIATRTDLGLTATHVEFLKGAWTRHTESSACDFLALNALLAAAKLRQLTPDNFMFNHTNMSVTEELPPLPTDLSGLIVEPDGTTTPLAKGIDAERDVLFCGSFNPWHPGHELMARQAEAMSGKRVVCMITDTHPTKGKIPAAELHRRADQFSYHRRVAFTSGDGLFIEKARRFPAAAFLVGYDVAMGILDPRFYGGDERARDAILAEFARLNTNFLVCGRLVKNDLGEERFRQANDLPVPWRFAPLFTPVTGRMDISSTELR